MLGPASADEQWTSVRGGRLADRVQRAAQYSRSVRLYCGQRHRASCQPRAHCQSQLWVTAALAPLLTMLVVSFMAWSINKPKKFRPTADVRCGRPPVYTGSTYFLRATAVPAGTAEARISYGNSVRLSICLSVCLSQPGGIPSPDEIETPGLHHMIAQCL